MEKTENFSFRNAEKSDTKKLLYFIKELAEHENHLNHVTATEELLAEWLFNKKMAEVFFVVAGDNEIGFALYFHNFSTFVGKAGIYLEDVYILPQYRGHGIGKAVFRHIAQIAKERGCERIDWWCHNENKSGIGFYLALEATPMDEWTVYRLGKSDIEKLSSNS